MATTPKYFTLTGDGALRKRVAGANYRALGNIRECVIALTQETVELKSTGNTAGTLAEDVISADATLRLVLENQAIDNAALALQATVTDIAASTDDITFAYPIGKAGDIVKLDHANVSDVTVTGKTEGTDFKVLANGSALQMLTDNASAITGCTYSHGAYQAMGLRTGQNDEFSFLFWSDKSKRTYEVLRFKLNPGEHALVADQFGQITLEGKLLLDETVDTSDLPAELKALGGYLRLVSVAA